MDKLDLSCFALENSNHLMFGKPDIHLSAVHAFDLEIHQHVHECNQYEVMFRNYIKKKNNCLQFYILKTDFNNLFFILWSFPLYMLHLSQQYTQVLLLNFSMIDQQTLRSEVPSQLLLTVTVMQIVKKELNVVYQGTFVILVVLTL